MIYYRKKRLGEVWRKFKGLIFLYIAFLVGWVYFNFFYDWNCDTNTSFILYPGFLKGWFSSFTEDVLFFGTGFMGLVITTRLLRDEAFETRISSLTNGENMNRRVETFFRKEVEKLLSFTTNRITTVEITKINNENTHIFAHVEIRWNIVNMCGDQKVPARITGTVEPGKKIDGEYGYVNLHTITPQLATKNAKGSYILEPTEFLIPQGHKINLNDLKGDRYSKVINHHINENGAAHMILSFEIWIPVNGDKDKDSDWFFDDFSGYTENYRLYINNKIINKNIFCNYKYVDRQSSIEPLEKVIIGTRVENNPLQPIVKDLEFLKRDKIKIYFYLA